MSKKSKLLLSLAGIALFMSLVFRLAPATPAKDASDFAVGLGAALMFGVLLTRNAHSDSER